jgi:hypothetical protein
MSIIFTIFGQEKSHNVCSQRQEINILIKKLSIPDIRITKIAKNVTVHIVFIQVYNVR